MGKIRKILPIILALRQNRTVSSRKYWVHPIIKKRDVDGEHVKLDRMYRDFPNKFFEYTRMSPPIFAKLLNLVEPHIRKKDTPYRESIPPRIRLYVTLRYLATGDNIRTIATNFSLGKTTVWEILTECLPALWTALKNNYVEWPSLSKLECIAEGFESRWNFPNCVGAIDGKHIVIKKPAKSGSLYLNYKGTFSIVLLASCDHNYKFTFVDVGAFGKQSDGGIFIRSSLGKRLEAGTLQLPQSKVLPGTCTLTPPCFVADEAFPLSVTIMRPYSARSGLSRSRRIFNYRLSRARRTIENAFGIMASRFRIFHRVIEAQPKLAEHIVLASVALHNFLKTEEEALDPSMRMYCPRGYGDTAHGNDGAWRSENQPNGLMSFRRSSTAAQERLSKNMREQLESYFVNEGAVSWQDDV